jgi:site-specific DNA-methyltransferase (adenine-specific)
MQLIHGDCLEKMKDIPDKSIDMILCDLPYGTTACKWDVVIPFEPLWEQYKRIIKPNGAILLFGSEPFSSYLRMSNIKQYKYDWYWRKSRPTGGLHAKKRPMLDIETISVFYRFQCFYSPQGVSDCNIVHKNTDGRKKGSGVRGADRKNDSYIQTKADYPRRVLDFSSPHNVGSFHPTQKPVALLEYLIKTYTLEGETVLDNCAGSFSTAIACLNTKRSFIGIEKDAHYFQVGKDRVEKHLITLDYSPEIVYYQV